MPEVAGGIVSGITNAHPARFDQLVTLGLMRVGGYVRKGGVAEGMPE
jgi:hypothetical protein